MMINEKEDKKIMPHKKLQKNDYINTELKSPQSKRLFEGSFRSTLHKSSGKIETLRS